ncbi:MAG: SDR family NAD(P)-dependent oxidoreductase [Bryobacterales bacterium]|nr:SDR family NAD(P)-dependent oxidoreductase [Bryobacterales bacterium]MBV9396976.1 SDR family NAD(P)-dependent oxidoreductase [Bryobacterales bacterium]
MDLRNKVALVTGGSSGIGRGIAETLLASGSRVAITGRNQSRLNATASAIGAHPVQADVSRQTDAARTIQEVLDKFGNLDILINNAGSGVFKPLVEMDLDGFQRTFATNVTGAFLMAREAARHFIARKQGDIVNIGSTASLRGAANGTAYYASKFALRGMTECWRAELRKHNIRVFLVNPSEVITSFGTAAGFQQKDHPSKLRPEDIAHAVKSMLEMNDRGFVPELTVFATNPVD